MFDAAPPAPPSYTYAAGDIYPVGDREKELCAKASHPDWLYLGALVAMDVGSVYLNSFVLKGSYDTTVRLAGPALIGLSWGATLGGGYLAMPKCEPHWVSYAPREGDVRVRWPLALSLALAAGISAPVIMSVATGPQQTDTSPAGSWSTEERAARLFVSGGFAFAGALLPYLLPPRTWRSARELERLRVTGDSRGAYATYAISF